MPASRAFSEPGEEEDEVPLEILWLFKLQSSQSDAQLFVRPSRSLQYRHVRITRVFNFPVTTSSAVFFFSPAALLSLREK